MATPSYRAFVYVDPDTGQCNSVGAQVIENEHAPVNTGLLDASGTPLYRMPENAPLGFKINSCQGK